MAAGFVQSKGGQSSSGSSVAITLSGVGSGNHLCTFTVTGGIATVAPTSSPVATWSNAIADFTDGTTNQRVDYSENVASGSWTVTLKDNSGSVGVTGTVNESSGVATSSSLGATNHGSNASTTVQPGSITTAANTSIVYTGVAGNGSGSSASTIGSSFTVDQAGGSGTCWDNANQGGGSAHKATPSATENPTWTTGWSGTSTMTASIVEFLAAGGGAAVEISHLLILGVT